MATKQQLKARWETVEGKQLAEALYQAFRNGTTLEQLHTIVAFLPYKDEVAPHLDLRGLQLEKSIFVKGLDLPGVRLDYSALRGNLSEGKWHGATFDGADVTQLSFELDLTGSSFIKVNARKTWFMKSVLNEANFSEAKLVGAHFDDVPCNGANFSNADLREAMCAGCDLRGANLVHAHLGNAVFGGVLFDEHTQVHDADFTGTSLSKDFREFITGQGIQLKPRDDSDSELATIKAAFDLIQEQVQAGNIESSLGNAVLSALTTIEQRMQDDPQYDWEAFVEELPDAEKAIIYAAYDEGMGMYEDYM